MLHKSIAMPRKQKAVPDSWRSDGDMSQCVVTRSPQPCNSQGQYTKQTVQQEMSRYDLTTLSLCPLGRPASAAEDGRFGIDESSCECCLEKKSSSPSYGDDEELICQASVSPYSPCDGGSAVKVRRCLISGARAGAIEDRAVVTSQTESAILTHCPSTSATLCASSGVKLTSVPSSACIFSSSLRVRLPAPRESDAFRAGVPSSAPFLGKETVLRGVFGRFGSASLLMERSQSSVSLEVRDSWDME